MYKDIYILICSRCARAAPTTYRGTGLIRNRPTLGPYQRPMPRVLGGTQGAGRFSWVKYPCTACAPSFETGQLRAVHVSRHKRPGTGHLGLPDQFSAFGFLVSDLEIRVFGVGVRRNVK